MADIFPLPESARKLIESNKHPGLLLDKYVKSWNATAPTGKLSELVQSPALIKVAELSQNEPDRLGLRELCDRRHRLLETVQARRFRATTAGTLMLHLARTSALENADICLHPI